MPKAQSILEFILKVLTMHNEADITCFYPKDYIKTLEFLKENINKQIDDLIKTEKTNGN